MRVIKRSGRVEDVKFDKVTNRISKLRYELSDKVDASLIAKQVFSSMYDNITTHEIDTLSAEICIGMVTSDPDYEILATRIVASNIQKTAPKTFYDAMTQLYNANIVTRKLWKWLRMYRSSFPQSVTLILDTLELKHWKRDIFRESRVKSSKHPNICLCACP